MGIAHGNAQVWFRLGGFNPLKGFNACGHCIGVNIVCIEQTCIAV